MNVDEIRKRIKMMKVYFEETARDDFCLMQLRWAIETIEVLLAEKDNAKT